MPCVPRMFTGGSNAPAGISGAFAFTWIKVHRALQPKPERSAAYREGFFSFDHGSRIVHPAHVQLARLACDKREFKIRVLRDSGFRLPDKQQVVVELALEPGNNIARDCCTIRADTHSTFHAVLDKDANANSVAGLRRIATYPDTGCAHKDSYMPQPPAVTVM